MKSVEASAIKAHREREEQRRAEREEAERRRKLQDADENRAVMRDVVLKSPLNAWFPDVDWRLVDRRFAQASAVVHPVDEPDILIRVTRITYDDAPVHQYMVSLVERTGIERSGINPWREVGLIKEPADLGRLLVGRKNPPPRVAADA